MKKALTLLFLLFFLGEIALAYKTTYLRPNRSLYGRNTLYGSNYAPLRSYYNPYRSNYIPRSSYYNPYSTYYSPYNYGGWGVWNNSQALRRFQGFRLLNRFFNGWTMNNNLIALKKDDKGTLTGYSVPVDEDIYNQNGASPYNSKPGTRQMKHPSNCNTDLFSAPLRDEMYYNNGEYYRSIGGASGKTGVTIIYD